MAVRLAKLKTSQLVFIEHTCETCGGFAPFGFGVSLRAAMNAFVAHKGDLGQKLLGRWFCSEHKGEAENQEKQVA